MDPQEPFNDIEDFEEWVRDNPGASLYNVYELGIEHGKNYQHKVSYQVGYKNGLRDGKLPINK